MRPLVLVLSAIMIASPAGAYPWPPAYCTIPAQIRIVTWDGVAPDSAAGCVSVTVRNLDYNPVFGSSVVITLPQVPDLRLAADQKDPAVTVRCAERSLRKLTGVDGSARFTIMGHSVPTAATSGPLLAQVHADGIWLGSVPVSILDLDGADGAGANDLSVWLADFGSLREPGRGDYDGDGRLGANDLSQFLAMFGARGSTLSPAVDCP